MVVTWPKNELIARFERVHGPAEVVVRSDLAHVPAGGIARRDCKEDREENQGDRDGSTGPLRSYSAVIRELHG
jgi:hypothetical protein